MEKKYLAPIAIALIAGALSIGCGMQTSVAQSETSAQEADAQPKEADATSSDNGSKKVNTIYEFKAKALDGQEINFDKYKGHVLLIVNTASKCGYTPQYEGLEELHKKYAGKGLDVLGFPCNQFGGQEPGDNEQIGTFCKKNYGVEFQIFDKIDVKGPNAHPIYKYLTEDEGPIKWNFTKFLINKNGEIVHRYDSKIKPKDIEQDIEKLL